ncbi:hypothetical protein BBO99_00000184 [Phytophthora kernoviae]|uniref:Uncharacterized protein n=2 Tax=Phytophthora kernoviae TaxID=325452 RepID=A0A3R7K165_9STRA|nr:hypothetical protein G195_001379 [Phytophthora kernoviae 00238/432]KAG2531455.1 hypothetical protein JM18_000354 [Phytophthora kernoviae]KAG2532629.1 hypothetical protein JM16_000249 [Phytophthora kernoviae]RLM96838.1 hypothetical protein BBI17_000286 [Phytophthora kernoviae]RLN85845.1 hypothetical protein BBO99_00000184 [Phytophthora kernoviae]
MFGSILAVVEGMRASPKEQRFRALEIEEVRDKRDMWNTVLAAPIAGAMVKVRHGPTAALSSTFMFGSFAAVVVAFNMLNAEVMHEKSPR